MNEAGVSKATAGFDSPPLLTDRKAGELREESWEALGRMDASQKRGKSAFGPCERPIIVE